MSHTIGTAENITVSVIYGSLTGIHTEIQNYIQSLSTGDKIVDISIVRKSVGNNLTAFVTVETS